MNVLWIDLDDAATDLPRLPVSGSEERPVEVALKRDRGGFGELPDSGIDTPRTDHLSATLVEHPERRGRQIVEHETRPQALSSSSL